MIRMLTRNSNEIPSLMRTLGNMRFLSRTHRMLDKSSTPAQTESSTPQTPPDAGQSPAQPWQRTPSTVPVTAYDKRVLVWTGKYKSVDEVPDRLARETIDRSRDKFRVKSCVYMMIVCIAACIVQIVRGKNAAERGESVVKSNLEWHRQYNESSTDTAKKQ